MARLLAGIMCALVTPLQETGVLDHRALVRLVDRVLAEGVDGVCPIGSTGEGPRLSLAQRVEIVATVRSRVPADRWLIPCVPARAPAEMTDEIRRYAEIGADAVLLAQPSGFLLNDREIYNYYESVARDCSLPIVVYHFPALTGITLDADLLVRLAEHPRIIGLKDSSRDFELLQAVCARVARKDFAVLTGADTLLMPSLLVGAAGSISASVNVVPRLSRDIFDAVRNGRLTQAWERQQELSRVVEMARKIGFPAGWKAMLAALGLCEPYAAPPALPPSADQVAAVGESLRRMGVH